jgi:hypothetical protein
MLPLSVKNAIHFFEQNTNSIVDREAVMAYATLYAFSHYYFDRSTIQITELLHQFRFIQKEEHSRVVKQKRIMSWILSREINEQQAIESIQRPPLELEKS